jgi:hypothetical protein
MERHKDASDHNGVRQLESVKPRSRRSSEAFKKLIVLTNIGILGALVTGVDVHNAMGINSPSQSGSTIRGITCDTEEQDLFHNHAHLDIFVNGHVISILQKLVSSTINAYTGCIHMTRQALYISSHL